MRAAGAALGLVWILAAAGCDWRGFDDLKKKTPVISITAPSNYSAKDEFGAILLPLAPPKDGSSAGRFVATATHLASVAVVSFDAAGGPSGLGVTGTAIDNLKEGPIKAIAEVPGEGKVVMGAPTGGYGDVLMMNVEVPLTPGAAPQYPVSTFSPTVGEGLYGVGVGGGQLGGGAAAEIIVTSSVAVHVYVDGQVTNDKVRMTLGAADPCPIEFSANLPDRDKVNRAVLVAPLTGGATQIAVGSPAVSGAGHVSVFDVDVTTGTFTCAAMLTGTATEAHFGRAMTLVDLDGQGGPDHLLVGAPPNRAYLYALPLSTGQAPSAMATDADGGDFGAAVAALNIDATPGDEMFIGNPDASAGGTSAAGAVTVYAGPTMALLPSTAFPNPLGEHEPGAGHAYGSGVAAMTFCPANVGGTADAGAGTAACGPLPIVGTLSKVLTYFTLKKPDPRVR